MSFELCSSKIQEAVDNWEDCGRSPHDRDIVDKIWRKILNSQLLAYVEALKIQYNQNPRSFREILLDIAIQIPNLKKVTFRRKVSEVSSGSSGTVSVLWMEYTLRMGSYSLAHIRVRDGLIRM